MKRFDSAPPSHEIEIERITEPTEGGPAKNKEWKAAVTALESQFKSSGQAMPIVVAAIRAYKDQPPNSKNMARYDMHYEMLSGYKRLEVAQRLSWKKIRAVIVLKDEETKDTVVKEWVRLIEGQQRITLSDYDLAKAAINMDIKWKICGREFAEQIGISKPYVYNLMRWFRSVPDEVREAWENQHPLLNQIVLERYSHMRPEDALIHWQSRQHQTHTSFDPLSKKRPPAKPRRANEAQLSQVEEAIKKAPLLDPVKDLCQNILRFAMGQSKEIPGITIDCQKLHRSIIVTKAA